MGQNILVTGGAGYIGGSLIADLISHTSGPLKDAKISAAVRSKEQVQALSKLDINVVQVDLRNEEAMKEAVLRNEIDIVVHTANSTDPNLPLYLIKALGERGKASGQETYFIHSSVTALYTVEGGWPAGEVKDTDPLFEKEKQIGGPHPVLQTNLVVTEQAKASAVTSFNVSVPQVYGTGTGEWNKLSVTIPAWIRSSIAHKTVYKFDVDSNPPRVHISDLTSFYALLIEKILLKESIPSGENGYYFVLAHKGTWWDTLQRLAECLHARGIIPEPTTQLWPSDEVAAEYLGFPLLYIRNMCTSGGDLIPENAYRLGWQPKWDEKRYLDSMDDEIRAVQELDTVKSNLFSSLRTT